MSEMRRFGIIDVVIIALMIYGIFATYSFFNFGRPDHIVVFRQNNIIAKYQLNDDAVFTANGKNGPIDIEITNGNVKISHVNCPRQICKRSGGISGTHGRIICAPNNILIKVYSSKSLPNNESHIDAVAY